MDKKSNHNFKYLKKYRQKLRNNLTPAEARLWKILKNRNITGRKFRRQHSIDNMIVDFYCPEEKLIIELDGEIHYNPVSENNDQKRDKKLNEYGFKVIRFENKIVFEQPEIIVKAIMDSFS